MYIICFEDAVCTGISQPLCADAESTAARLFRQQSRNLNVSLLQVDPLNASFLQVDPLNASFLQADPLNASFQQVDP